MTRTMAGALLVLGLMVSTTQAQSIKPINPNPGGLQAYGPPFDFSVMDVLSITTVSPDTRRAALRLANGAMISVDFWSPATPPAFTFRRFLHQVPATFMTRALQSIQANPSAYTRPFTLGKIWKSDYNTVYEAYEKSELHVLLTNPNFTPDVPGSNGGVAQVYIAASGLATADSLNPPIVTGQTLTWGRVVLETPTRSLHNYYFLSNMNPPGPLAPLTTVNADALSTLLYSGSFWVHFGSPAKDPINNEKIVHNNTGFTNF